MHPSIIKGGGQLQSTSLHSWAQFGCPLCPKFSTTQGETLRRHLGAHVQNAVHLQGGLRRSCVFVWCKVTHLCWNTLSLQTLSFADATCRAETRVITTVQPAQKQSCAKEISRHTRLDVRDHVIKYHRHVKHPPLSQLTSANLHLHHHWSSLPVLPKRSLHTLQDAHLQNLSLTLPFLLQRIQSQVKTTVTHFLPKLRSCPLLFHHSLLHHPQPHPQRPLSWIYHPGKKSVLLLMLHALKQQS